jgi:hypothetical protein
MDARIAENPAPIVDQSALDIRTTKIDTDKIGWFCARQWVDFSLGHESQRTKMVATTGNSGGNEQTVPQNYSAWIISAAAAAR